MKQVIVTVQKGLIQVEAPDGVEVIVRDYDTDGIEPDRLSKNEYGSFVETVFKGTPDNQVQVETCDLNDGDTVIHNGEQKTVESVFEDQSKSYYEVVVTFVGDDEEYLFGEGDRLTVLQDTP